MIGAASGAKPGGYVQRPLRGVSKGIERITQPALDTTPSRAPHTPLPAVPFTILHASPIFIHRRRPSRKQVPNGLDLKAAAASVASSTSTATTAAGGKKRGRDQCVYIYLWGLCVSYVYHMVYRTFVHEIMVVSRFLNDGGAVTQAGGHEDGAGGVNGGHETQHERRWQQQQQADAHEG